MYVRLRIRRLINKAGGAADIQQRNQFHGIEEAFREGRFHLSHYVPSVTHGLPASPVDAA
jgi:hypothetical protein